jgi:GntR family transcriptional repressor for pyruvate dehydrogenase complex
MAKSKSKHASFRPIKKVDLTLEVVARIKQLLVDGRLRAGSRLPTERELAELLQISRPSVRQALKALSFMGLIKSCQGSGTYISDSGADILLRPMEFLPLVHNLPLAELFETRSLVEVKLAALAARRATEDDLAAMQGALKASRQHLSDQKKFALDEIRFHRAVCHATGNSTLARAMDMLYKLLQELTRPSITTREDREEIVEYHERIYAPIAAGDEVAATRAMEEHFEYTVALLSRKGLLIPPEEKRRDEHSKGKRRAALKMRTAPPSVAGGNPELMKPAV